MSGLSKKVIDTRNALILSQIEQHAPNKEKYTLIAKVVNVGVALLVYGRDDGIGKKVQDVQTQWTGCGPAYMGNKGAVGVRFRVPTEGGGLGEVYTYVAMIWIQDGPFFEAIYRFVCAHMTAHAHKLAQRVNDFHYITNSLLFPPLPGSGSSAPTTMYSTSHLFFFGDLNFRLTSLPVEATLSRDQKELAINAVLHDEDSRKELVKLDQLVIERDLKGTIFAGLREGEFWKFKCTYKYKLGEVDKYECVSTLFMGFQSDADLLNQHETMSFMDRQGYVHHVHGFPRDTPILFDHKRSLYLYTIIYYLRPRQSTAHITCFVYTD